MSCPSKTFAYAQEKRPILTCRFREVAISFGESARYLKPTSEAFSGKVRAIFSEPAPDMDYAPESHTWARRADTLLSRLRK